MRNLGDYIREQRNSAQISLRQLAKLAGVSNPYLSQIERGLRKPSAEILQQIAKALRISAEALYVQAGILDERYGDSDVPTAVLGDPGITDRQKQVLLEIYDSFRRENDESGPPAADAEPFAEADREAVLEEPRAHNEQLETYQDLLDESLHLTFPASDPISAHAATRCADPMETPARWSTDTIAPAWTVAAPSSRPVVLSTTRTSPGCWAMYTSGLFPSATATARGCDTIPGCRW